MHPPHKISLFAHILDDRYFSILESAASYPDIRLSSPPGQMQTLATPAASVAASHSGGTVYPRLRVLAGPAISQYVHEATPLQPSKLVSRPCVEIDLIDDQSIEWTSSCICRETLNLNKSISLPLRLGPTLNFWVTSCVTCTVLSSSFNLLCCRTKTISKGIHCGKIYHSKD